MYAIQPIRLLGVFMMKLKLCKIINRQTARIFECTYCIKAKHDAIWVKVPWKPADNRRIIPAWQNQIYSRCKCQMANLCHIGLIYRRNHHIFRISIKFQACIYLLTLYAGTVFRSNHSWALGSGCKTKTMAHGYVYKNKLTDLKHEIPWIYPAVICIQSINFFLDSCHADVFISNRFQHIHLSIDPLD